MVLAAVERLPVVVTSARPTMCLHARLMHRNRLTWQVLICYPSQVVTSASHQHVLLNLGHGREVVLQGCVRLQHVVLLPNRLAVCVGPLVDMATKAVLSVAALDQVRNYSLLLMIQMVSSAAYLVSKMSGNEVSW